jgi:DNA-binding Lrp family transcriptional regulator
MIEKYCYGYENVERLEAKAQRIIEIMRKIGEPTTASEIAKEYEFTRYSKPQAVTAVLHKLIEAGIVKREELIAGEREVEISSGGRMERVLIADEVSEDNVILEYHWEIRRNAPKVEKVKFPIKRIEFSLVSAD